MRAVSIIPARGGSKGLSRKNLVEVCGRPLLAWTIAQSLKATQVDETFVSTDDHEIAELAAAEGARVISRPSNISGDEASSESALHHALDHLRDTESINPEIVVFLQATSPLRKNYDIERALNEFQASAADSLISVSPADDLLLWTRTDDGIDPVNFDHQNRGRRQDRAAQFAENGSIYIFRPEVLRQFDNRVGGNIATYEMDAWQMWEIDTQEDVELVEFFLRNKVLARDWSRIDPDGIDLIALDFDGVLTDNRALVSSDGSEAVAVNRADGLGISELKKRGFSFVIVSTEANPVVGVRAAKLEVPCLQGVSDKLATLGEHCSSRGSSLERCLFVGNDVNDLGVMSGVGYTACPADAHAEVRRAVDVVLTVVGGAGVVRELLDHL